jgi:hypothetical protein
MALALNYVFLNKFYLNNTSGARLSGTAYV